MPRVLLYDVESFPNIAMTWGKYEQTALHFVRERMVCAIGWKWLDQKGVHYLALPDYKGYRPSKPSSKKLVTEFRKVLSQADVTVAHNGDRFDDRMLNAEFLRHGLKPLPPRQTVDTLKVSRKYFRLNSNRLDDLGSLLKVGRKVKHEGFDLWLQCMAGNTEAWTTMRSYCVKDVALLESVYLKLRPWMHKHPDLSNLERNWNCPKCQSPRMQRRGWSYSLAAKKPRLMCLDCGGWSLGARKSDQKR